MANIVGLVKMVQFRILALIISTEDQVNHFLLKTIKSIDVI